jgi:hypothetical protein
VAHASPRQSSPIGSLPAVTDTAHASPGQSSALPAHSPLPVSSAVLSGPSSTLSPSPSPVPPTSCRMSQHDGPSSTLDALQSSVSNSLAQQSSPSSAHTSSTPVSSPTVPVAASTVRNIHPMLTRAKAGIVKPKRILSLSTSVAEVEPTSFSQENKSTKWKEAMAEEYNALLANDTWDLVPAIPGQNLVGSKWVYKVKYRSDGAVERHKAREVAQGIHQ